MKFYALVLWRTTGTIPRLLQLMYLGDREVLYVEVTAGESALAAFMPTSVGTWAMWRMT